MRWSLEFELRPVDSERLQALLDDVNSSMSDFILRAIVATENAE
jgi:hypothetical protein